MPVKEIVIQPSNIENIDTAMFEYVRDLELQTHTNDGLQITPVIWLGTERAYQIKNNKALRDDVGKLHLPMMSVNRDSIAKDPAFKGAFQAHMQEHPDYKGGVITIVRRVQQEKTRNFANADTSRERKGDETSRRNNNKIVYEEITIPNPSYITVMYTLAIRTEYQEQMNNLVAPFISKTGNINSFLIKRHGWKYEVFIQQEFTENKNVDNLGEEERMFETKIQFKVLGVLVGEGLNREKPKVTIRETRTDVRISRERVIVGDKRPWVKKDKDYREF